MAQFDSGITEEDLDLLMASSGVTATPEMPEKVEDKELEGAAPDTVEKVEASTIETPIPELKKEVVEVDLESLVDEETEETKKETNKVDQGNIFKATAKLYLERAGLDEDILNQVETWDEETFGELADEIFDHQVSERYANLKQSNPVAEKVLSILEEGGEVNEILALYKEQRRAQSIDTSTTKGKIEKIRRYYKDIEQKTPAWIDRTIDRIATNEDDLDFEFSEINGKYDSHFEAEAEARVEQERRRNEAKAQHLARQQQKIEDFLVSQKIKKGEIEDIKDFVFNDNAYEIKGTNKRLSALDAKIALAKQKPEELLELVEFIKDKEKYKQRIITQANNVRTDQKFSALLKQTPSTKGSDVAASKPERTKFRLT